MAATRIRRTDEQLIADLEARIAGLKTRAIQRKAKANPAVRHTTAAVKSISKALQTTVDITLRNALQEAQATLSACLALDGVVVASGTAVRRSSPVTSDALLDHVKKNPGQRGEQIAQALRTDAKALRSPMKKLIEAKKVRTQGQRRRMTYAVA